MTMNPVPSADLPQIPGLEEYIDLQDGLGRIRGNRKIYKTLLQSFLNKNNMEELKTQIVENNLEDAAKSVHTIKGVSANLSLTALNKSMIELEAQVKTGSYKEETYKESLEIFANTTDFISMLLQQL